jgi:hypothetical protein
VLVCQPPDPALGFEFAEGAKRQRDVEVTLDIAVASSIGISRVVQAGSSCW